MTAPTTLPNGRCPKYVGPLLILLSGVLAVLPMLALGQQTGTLTVVPPSSSATGDITSVGLCTAADCFSFELANLIYASPDGLSGTPTFRSITLSDLPLTLATDIELSAAISAHAAISSAHHVWPLTDAEVPDAITLAAASVTAHEAALTIDWPQLTSVPLSLADGDDDTIFTPNADPGIDHTGYVAGHGDGTNCLSGSWSAGTDASGNAQGCTPDDTGTDDQTAVEVPYAPTTGVDWTDPDPTHVGGGLDQLANRLTDEEAKVDTDTFAGYTATGADLGVVTGTAGGAGICAEWNVDGDLVAAASAAACGAGGGIPSRLDSTGDTTSSEVIVNGSTVWFDVNADATEDFRMASPSGFTRLMLRDQNAGPNRRKWMLHAVGNANTAVLQIGLMNDAESDWVHQAEINVTHGDSSYILFGHDLRKEGDLNTGLTWSAADVVGLTAGGVLGLSQSATETTIATELVNAPTSHTCADSGDGNPGFRSVTVSGTSNVELTNSDADGCTAALSETGATRGQVLTISLVSNAGGTVNFADTAGTQETGTGCSLAVHGVAVFRYITDRWLLQSCTPSN